MRPGGALLRGGFRLRSRHGDDLHPLRCLLLDFLTAGSPEEAGSFALRLRLLPLRGGGRSRDPPGGRGASIILGAGDSRRPEILFLIDPRFGQK
jgi:hypothetical protein